MSANKIDDNDYTWFIIIVLLFIVSMTTHRGVMWWSLKGQWGRLYSPPSSSHLWAHLMSNNYLSSPIRVSHW